MSILNVIGRCNYPRKGVQFKPFVRLQLFTIIYVKQGGLSTNHIRGN